MPICQRCGREVEQWEIEYFGEKLVDYNCFQLELADARRRAEEEAEQCVRCGRRLPYWNYRTFEGRVYCSSCFGVIYGEWKRANSCARCGKLLPEKWDQFRGPRGELLCREHYEEARRPPRFGAKVQCTRCGKLVLALKDLAGRRVCLDCFEELRK